MTNAKFREDVNSRRAGIYDPEIILDTMTGQGIYVPPILKEILWNYDSPGIQQSLNAKVLEVVKIHKEEYRPVPEKYQCT